MSFTTDQNKSVFPAIGWSVARHHVYPATGRLPLVRTVLDRRDEFEIEHNVTPIMEKDTSGSYINSFERGIC